VQVGQEVLVTEEANRLEKYLGDVGDDDKTPLYFTEGGYDGDELLPSPQITTFTAGLNGRNRYQISLEFNSNGSIYWSGTQWEFESETDIIYTNSDDVQYPWQITSPWVEGPDNTGDDLPPVFIKAPFANEENWEIVGANTVRVFAKGSDGDEIVKGVTVTSLAASIGPPTEIGWHKVDQLLPYSASDLQLKNFNQSPSAVFTSDGFVDLVLYFKVDSASRVLLPNYCPPRGNIFLYASS
jgi:hypothetical protein